jgi:hypothetical protein
MSLAQSQRRAAEHDGRNLQLIACAGSGKTEVVARGSGFDRIAARAARRVAEFCT